MIQVNDEKLLTTATGKMRVATAEDWVTEEETPDPAVNILNEYICIRPLQVTSKTKGGIILPSVVKEHNQQLVTVGRVIGIGEYAGKRANVSRPEVGDYVVFPKHGGAQLTIRGVKVVIIPDDAVFAKVTREDIFG